MTAAPLYGLVLAGGRSTRMQRDKAALEYAGRSQLERAIELATPLVERLFVSVRRDQTGDPLRARFPQIVDSGEVEGPIAGIMAAQSCYPDAAWLVLACDLPLLDPATLRHLLRARRPERQATAYRSSRDGLPEPLCAIYEPSSREAIRAYIAAGRDCPRKFLLNSNTALLSTACRPPQRHPLQGPHGRSTFSTTPCCANKPDAAPNRWSPTPQHRVTSIRSSRGAIRSRLHPRCCGWRSTRSLATGSSGWPRATR